MRKNTKEIITSFLTLLLVLTGCNAAEQDNAPDVNKNNAAKNDEEVISIIENLIIETADEMNWPKTQFHHSGGFYSYTSPHKETCEYYTGDVREYTFDTGETIGYWPITKKDTPCRWGYATKENAETSISDFDAKRERCHQISPDAEKYSCSKGPYMYSADYTLLTVGDYKFYARVEKQGSLPGTSAVSQNSEEIANILVENIKEHYKDGVWYE